MRADLGSPPLQLFYRSHAGDHMMCSLCHQSLNDPDEPTVATTDGGRVHIVCADRDARAAYRARTIRAVGSGMVGILCGLRAMGRGLGIEGWELSAEGWALRVVLAVVLIAAHILINRRWWRYHVQPAWLRWRMLRKD